jgi:hypothetical protein
MPERRNEMEMDALRSFFLWCTVIDAGLIGLTIVATRVLGDFAYRAQSWWFPISKDTYYTIMCAWVGTLKIFWVVFNLVPLVALHIIKG